MNWNQWKPKPSAQYYSLARPQVDVNLTPNQRVFFWLYLKNVEKNVLKINKLALYLHPVCCSLITKIPNWQLQFNMNTVYFSPVSFFQTFLFDFQIVLFSFALHSFSFELGHLLPLHSITLAIWDIIQIITGAFNSQHILHGVRNSRVEKKNIHKVTLDLCMQQRSEWIHEVTPRHQYQQQASSAFSA